MSYMSPFWSGVCFVETNYGTQLPHTLTYKTLRFTHYRLALNYNTVTSTNSRLTWTHYRLVMTYLQINIE